jgi:hypothetical protein
MLPAHNKKVGRVFGASSKREQKERVRRLRHFASLKHGLKKTSIRVRRKFATTGIVSDCESLSLWLALLSH